MPVGEARVDDPIDVVAAGQELGDGQGIRRVALDPEMERPQAAQHEEAVERPGHAAHRVLEEAQPLGDRVVIRDRHAKDRVRVAGEVLRRRVEDDVGPEGERSLDRRRSERVVDDDQRPDVARLGSPLTNGLRDCRDIDDLQVRVGRRLEPDEAGAPGQLLPERVGAGRQVRVMGVDAGWAVDALEVAERAAVDVVADDDLIAGDGELGDRRRRRRSARERDPVGAALERRDRPLEPFAGRVLGPGVLVAAPRAPDAVLGVGRRLVDRRRNGAGQLVGLGAGVNGEGVELGSGSFIRASSPIRGSASAQD